MKKKYRNVAGTRLYIGAIMCVFIATLYLFDQFHYVTYLFNAKWYVEPAENENIVLVDFLSKHWNTNTTDLLKSTIIQIYPDLFHRIASLLPFNPLVSSRAVSLFALTFSQIAVGYVIFLRTHSIAISLLCPLILFGAPSHELYFMMARTDSLYIFFGLLALLIYTSYVKYDIKNFISILPFVCSGMLIGMSICTKQTGLAFLMYISILSVLNDSKFFSMVALKKLFITLGATLAFVLFYLSIFNNNIFAFTQGLTMFASNPISISSLINSGESTEFIHKWYFILLIAAMLLVLRDLLDGKFFSGFRLLMILIVSSLVTIKLWMNDAAFSNNFIFISLGFIIAIINVDLTRYTKVVVMVACFAVIIGNYLNINFPVNHNELKNLTYNSIKSKLRNFHTVKAVAASKNSDLMWPDSICQYMLENRGVYVTNRLDYYNIASSNPIVFEASVNGMYAYERAPLDNIKTDEYRKIVTENVNNLRQNIILKKYTGIITGLNDENFKSWVPDFDKYYEQTKVVRTSNGIFDFNATLYIPK